MDGSDSTVASRDSAELPPMYSELLSSARRMLERAENQAWAALLSEEMEFFKAYERVVLHEGTSGSEEAASDHERELCEEVHSEVRRHVNRSRELLVARQAELERELQMERACASRFCPPTSMESMPVPVW